MKTIALLLLLSGIAHAETRSLPARKEMDFAEFLSSAASRGVLLSAVHYSSETVNGWCTYDVPHGLMVVTLFEDKDRQAPAYSKRLTGESRWSPGRAPVADFEAAWAVLGAILGADRKPAVQPKAKPKRPAEKKSPTTR